MPRSNNRTPSTPWLHLEILSIKVEAPSDRELCQEGEEIPRRVNLQGGWESPSLPAASHCRQLQSERESNPSRGGWFRSPCRAPTIVGGNLPTSVTSSREVQACKCTIEVMIAVPFQGSFDHSAKNEGPSATPAPLNGCGLSPSSSPHAGHDVLLLVVSDMTKHQGL